MSTHPPHVCTRAHCFRLNFLDALTHAVPTLSPWRWYATAVASLTSLLTLNCNQNAVGALSLNFGGLSRLETLALSGNRLTALPDEVSAAIPVDMGHRLHMTVGYLLFLLCRLACCKASLC